MSIANYNQENDQSWGGEGTVDPRQIIADYQRNQALSTGPLPSATSILNQMRTDRGFDDYAAASTIGAPQMHAVGGPDYFGEGSTTPGGVAVTPSSVVTPYTSSQFISKTLNGDEIPWIYGDTSQPSYVRDSEGGLHANPDYSVDYGGLFKGLGNWNEIIPANPMAGQLAGIFDSRYTSDPNEQLLKSVAGRLGLSDTEMDQLAGITAAEMYKSSGATGNAPFALGHENYTPKYIDTLSDYYQRVHGQELPDDITDYLTQGGERIADSLHNARSVESKSGGMFSDMLPMLSTALKFTPFAPVGYAYDAYKAIENNNPLGVLASAAGAFGIPGSDGFGAADAAQLADQGLNASQIADILGNGTGSVGNYITALQGTAGNALGLSSSAAIDAATKGLLTGGGSLLQGDAFGMGLTKALASGAGSYLNSTGITGNPVVDGGLIGAGGAAVTGGDPLTGGISGGVSGGMNSVGVPSGLTSIINGAVNSALQDSEGNPISGPSNNQGSTGTPTGNTTGGINVGPTQPVVTPTTPVTPTDTGSGGFDLSAFLAGLPSASSTPYVSQWEQYAATPTNWALPK